MKFILIRAVLMICLPFGAGAQNTIWQIYGFVHNEHAEPLGGARIEVDDSISVNADEGGFFQLNLAYQPKYMTLRCIGYFPKRVSLLSKDFKRQKAVIDVSLMPQNTDLPEVAIAAKKVEMLVEEDFQTDILDFDFAGEYLLVLIKEKKRFALQLRSDRGKVLQSITLPEAPLFLHRGCYGDLLVVSTYHVNEITLSDAGRVDTFPRFGIRRFKQLIEPCVQENQGYLYFKKEGTLQQALTYWYLTPSGERKKLYTVIDEKGLKDAIEAYVALMEGAPFTSRGPSATTPAINATKFGLDLAHPEDYINFPIDMKEIFRAMGSETAGWISLLQRIEADSVYAPLLKIGETLLLFDHVNGKIWQFDPTFQVNAVREISYHKEEGWLKELLQDYDIPRIIYAHFAPKGVHDVRKINLGSGQIERKYELAEIDYLSQNFKIRHGNLYYLGQPDVNVPNHTLYKVNIAQKGK